MIRINHDYLTSGTFSIQKVCEQFEQISINFRFPKIFFLKSKASLPRHISRKLCCARLPNQWVASLSKQHGTTFPSQVSTHEPHIRKQELGKRFLRMNWFSGRVDERTYREYFGFTGISGLPFL